MIEKDTVDRLRSQYDRGECFDTDDLETLLGAAESAIAWRDVAEAMGKLYDNRTMVNRLRSGRLDMDAEELAMKAMYGAARIL